MTATLSTIYATNMRDIPAMAEKLATDIRAGVHGELRNVVAVLEKADGGVEIFGWGDAGLLETLGLFQIASDEIVRMRRPT